MRLPSGLPTIDDQQEIALIVKPGFAVLHFCSGFEQQRHGGIGRFAAIEFVSVTQHDHHHSAPDLSRANSKYR
jgi:hypothetical protein